MSKSCLFFIVLFVIALLGCDLESTSVYSKAEPEAAAAYKIAPKAPGAGYTSTILYGVPGQLNTYEVVAVDSAGNRSAAASISTFAG